MRHLISQPSHRPTSSGITGPQNFSLAHRVAFDASARTRCMWILELALVAYCRVQSLMLINHAERYEAMRSGFTAFQGTKARLSFCPQPRSIAYILYRLWRRPTTP
jgi:hypothetical protein